MLRVLDLFSGIGGFSLGLERTGHFRTVAFCEIDKKARQVLRKHWPAVEQFDDVRLLSAAGLELCGIEPIDVICGGFPCQDISLAGKGAGLSGERSGLWFEYFRLIDEIKPSWVIIENVSALRSRGLDVVLSGLAEIGYDAEWHCIPASAVGAPHRRDRVWVVGYPHNYGSHGAEDGQGRLARSNGDEEGAHQVGEPARPGCARQGDVSHTAGVRLQGQGQPQQPVYTTPLVSREAIEPKYGCVAGQWAVEPNVGRVAHGVPGRVDRLKQLGNAVVPQIPELIGNAIAKVHLASKGTKAAAKVT